MKYGKTVSVTIEQHGQAYLGSVRFRDELDCMSMGTRYKYVSPSSMRRLATAINNSNMRLELDEYGVPTWTRNVSEVRDE